MELGRRIAGYPLFENVRRRLSAFQIASAQPGKNSQKIKTIRGLALVFISIVFGWISVEAAISSGVARYRTDTWPKESILAMSLRERGLERRHSLGEYSRQLQTLPEAFSENAMIWVSPNGCMVYFTAPPYSDHSSQLWTCEADPKPPAAWLKAGSGLEGFEKLSEFLEKRPKTAAIRPKQRLNIIDPKEIRY